MKKTILLIILIFIAFSIISFSVSFQNKFPPFFNEITGTYLGYLSVGSTDLRLVLVISKDLFKENEFSAILI